jgi:hypothetical protein
MSSPRPIHQTDDDVSLEFCSLTTINEDSDCGCSTVLDEDECYEISDNELTSNWPAKKNVPEEDQSRNNSNSILKVNKPATESKRIVSDHKLDRSADESKLKRSDSFESNKQVDESKCSCSLDKPKFHDFALELPVEKSKNFSRDGKNKKGEPSETVQQPSSDDFEKDENGNHALTTALYKLKMKQGYLARKDRALDKVSNDTLILDPRTEAMKRAITAKARLDHEKAILYKAIGNSTISSATSFIDINELSIGNFIYVK